MKRTKYPTAIWHNAEEPAHYAFPVGAQDPWGGDVLPLINDHRWKFIGYFPAGVPVESVEQVKGNKVRCRMQGADIFTGDWAIEDDGKPDAPPADD